MNAKITDFADYTDLVAWTDKASEFLTPEQIDACNRVGDNGIGASGKVTATLDVPMCALPEDVIKARWGPVEAGWGKPVLVTWGGKTILVYCEDGSPEGDVDLNPRALSDLGAVHPFDEQGSWIWMADAEPSQTPST